MWNANAALGRETSLFLTGPLAGERPPVIVFRSCWVTEGIDLETDLLTPTKRWKQEGNRAERGCASSTESLITRAHAQKPHETPRAIVTDADMLPDTYRLFFLTSSLCLACA